MTSKGLFKAALEVLNLEPVLLNGQAFRWIKSDPDVFYGVACSRLWRLERVDEASIRWRVLARCSTSTVAKEDEAVLRGYLQMDVSLDELYEQWKAADTNFERFLKKESLRGIRILSQEPLECLLSFICSANNNIKRISKLVNQLAVIYGDRLDGIEDGEEFEKITALHPTLAHAFPHLDQFRLEGMTEQLRRDGFGYRAGYIRNTVEKLQSEDGEAALERQKSASTKDAKAFLMGFAGIGPKVADCILLMSLGHAAVVPLDVHMWNITRSMYLPALPSKAATSRYEEVASFYLSKFGAYAGWAQAVLFNAQLGKTEKKAATDEKEEFVDKKKSKRK